jgi:hypothetical protein
MQLEPYLLAHFTNPAKPTPESPLVKEPPEPASQASCNLFTMPKNERERPAAKAGRKNKTIP